MLFDFHEIHSLQFIKVKNGGFIKDMTFFIITQTFYNIFSVSLQDAIQAEKAKYNAYFNKCNLVNWKCFVNCYGTGI